MLIYLVLLFIHLFLMLMKPFLLSFTRLSSGIKDYLSILKNLLHNLIIQILNILVYISPNIIISNQCFWIKNLKKFNKDMLNVNVILVILVWFVTMFLKK